LPVITFDYEGYELIEKLGCGVCIASLQDLPQAIKKIMDSYDVYRENAFKAFSQHYDYSKHFKGINHFFKTLAKQSAEPR
jgi:hypothetical protein